MDKWEEIGTYDVLKYKSKDKANSESLRSIILIDVKIYDDVNVDDCAIKQSIMDTTQQACTHEHDCCGCLFGGADYVRKVSWNKFVAVCNYYRNI